MDLANFDWRNIDWAALLEMNGYGRYVWPAYAVALIVLLAITVQSVRSLRRRKAQLEALQPGERRARRSAARPPAEPHLAGQRPERPAP